MIGIDEVGRGSWAGPLLVVAARQTDSLPAGLADSKVLSKRQREQLVPEINACCQLGEGWVEPAEIDQLGLTGAMRLGVRRTLEAISARLDELILLDGHINYCDATYTNVRCIINGDASVPLISAASIFAKQRRDAYMRQQATLFPGYDFEKHVGYGTKKHIEALNKLGLCELHRLSYKPVQVFAK